MTRMLMNITKILGMCLLVSFLPISCISFEDEVYAPSLIVEGWIGEGDYPVVQLGQSMSLDSLNKDFSDYVVHWGVVTISDGIHTEVLRARYDDHYFPPYIYTSYNMVGEPGKTYTITAKYQNHEATSTTTVPQKAVRIDSLRIVHVKDDLHYIKIFFTDDPDKDDYYLVSTQRVGKDLSYQISMMGALSDHLLQKNNNVVQMDVYKGDSFISSTSKDDNIYFVEGDKVKVRLMKIDYESYLFWNSFLQYKGLSSNMLFPYTSELKSNISDGKGYWCGFQSDETYVQIGTDRE